MPMRIRPRTDETLERVSPEGLSILQKRGGYRYSIDALLLADFVRLRGEVRLLEIGLGCGIVSLLLGSRYPQAKIIGIELQAMLADLARRNIRLNRMSDRVSVIRGDMKNLPEHFPRAAFDRIISNPPYRRKGSGRLSVDLVKRLAKHEIAMNIESLLDTVVYLLKPKGRLNLVYPPGRLRELMGAMAERGIVARRLQPVHTSSGGPEILVLVEGVSGGSGLIHRLDPVVLDQRRPPK